MHTQDWNIFPDPLSFFCHQFPHPFFFIIETFVVRLPPWACSLLLGIRYLGVFGVIMGPKSVNQEALQRFTPSVRLGPGTWLLVPQGKGLDTRVLRKSGPQDERLLLKISIRLGNTRQPCSLANITEKHLHSQFCHRDSQPGVHRGPHQRCVHSSLMGSGN